MSLARVATAVPSSINGDVYTGTLALRILHGLRGTLAEL
jgi:hypothetical protein